MEIREATVSDLDALLAVHRQAFAKEGPVIVDLVAALLQDDTAQPRWSFVAVQDSAILGHILFTHVQLVDKSHPQLSPSPKISLLCPLAVVPAAQGQGIGGALIEQGASVLAAAGVAGLFVLGYPSYYPRHGFQPAGPGFVPPYPLSAEQADAWMLRVLQPEIHRYSGTLHCAEALMRPEYWQE